MITSFITNLLQTFLQDPSSPLTVSFLFGFTFGALVMWIFAYRRYKRTRRVRHMHRLSAIRETSRLEKEME